MNLHRICSFIQNSSAKFLFHLTSFRRPPDLYHTCYTLSGVAIAQHSEIDEEPTVIGDALNNELLPTHPIYNVPPKCVWQAYMHYQPCGENGHTNNDVQNQSNNNGNDDDVDVDDFMMN